ncbi:ABC transporter substrate-binding protein [bacterium]|nr:ABC transporter substrate-binding protein [bacterium]
MIISILGSKRSQAPSIQSIGIIGPFSGEVASMGESVRRTIDLALATSTRAISPLYEDDQCDGKKAISAYESLKLKNVHVFYIACSGSVMAVAPLAKQDGNLIVTAYAGSSEIRKLGDEVIRFIPDALTVIDAMVANAEAHPMETYAVLFENQDYARSVADGLEQRLGKRIVAKEAYLSSDKSFLTHIAKVKAARASAIIYVPVSDVSAQIVLKEMKQLQVRIPIIGDVNLCDYSFSPKDFGLHGMCWKANLSTPGFTAFVDSSKAAYGVAPQYPFYDAVTYDVMTVLNKLIPSVSSIADLKKKLLAGVSGPVTSYSFDMKGQLEGIKYLEVVNF